MASQPPRATRRQCCGPDTLPRACWTLAAPTTRNVPNPPPCLRAGDTPGLQEGWQGAPISLHAGKEAGRRLLNPPGPATPPKTKLTSGSETLLDQNIPGRSGLADTKSDALNHRDAHLASDHPLIRDPIRGIQPDLSLRAPSMPLETPFPYQHPF